MVTTPETVTGITLMGDRDGNRNGSYDRYLRLVTVIGCLYRDAGRRVVYG